MTARDVAVRVIDSSSADSEAWHRIAPGTEIVTDGSLVGPDEAMGHAVISKAAHSLFDRNEFSPARLRAAGRAIGQSLQVVGRLRVDLADLEEALQAVYAGALTEGVLVGARTPGRDDERAGGEFFIVVSSAAYDAARRACRRATVCSKAINLARGLVDLPPSELTPTEFATRAARLASAHSWDLASLHGPELGRAGFTAIDAVGRGSDRESWLIDVHYAGASSGPPDVVLIGKGVTIDCGGLNIKTNRQAVSKEKCDMAGGAAVLACLAAISEMRVRLNVRALVPSVENLPGADAIRPGDVITHYGGRLTEVIDTDAEGRLLISDCLAYASDKWPKATCIDVGTLSGTPFGPATWTASTSDPRLGAALVRAAMEAGEVAVLAPVLPVYREWLSSSVADSTNCSYAHGRFDMALSALFLSQFVATSSWAHLDITESAYLRGSWDNWPEGATGSPTGALIALLEGWADQSP